MANRTYDFVLTVITVFALSMIGAVCAYGTAFSYFASKADANWSSSAMYSTYLARMNALAFPLILILLIFLVLCIPKRIIARRFLYISTASIFLIVTAVGLLSSPINGFGFMLLFAMAVQSYVIVKTVQGSKNLFFQKESRVSRLGSGFLHLGILLFFYDLTVLNVSKMHLIVFWFAAFLITGGNILCFYPNIFKANPANPN